VFDLKELQPYKGIFSGNSLRAALILIGKRKKERENSIVLIKIGGEAARKS